MPTLNAHAKILLSAVQLEERGDIPFTQEKLIIEVWKRYPDTFGLRKYEKEHPDSNKVIANLSGKSGMVHKELLTRIDTELYVLTPKGRDIAYEVTAALDLLLGKSPPTPLPTKNGLNEDVNKFCDRIMESKALSMLMFNEQGLITLPIAFQFWGIHSKANGVVLDACMEEFNGHLETVRRVVLGSDGNIVLRNGRCVGWDDMARIQQVHSYMLDKFKSVLGLLKNRKRRKA